MSRTEAFNIPRNIRLASGRYVCARALSQIEWGTLSQYLVDHVPSPLEMARRALEKAPLLPDQLKRSIVYEASQEPWPPRVLSSAWRKAMDRAPDQAGLQALTLKVMLPDDLNPGLDRKALEKALTADDFARLFEACIGFDPAPDEGDGDPKAETPDTAPASPTTSTGGPLVFGS